MDRQDQQTQERRIAVAAVRLVRRRRSAVAIMILGFGLVLGSVVLSPVAQADLAHSARLGYFMIAKNISGSSTICVGDRVTLTVRVQRASFTGNQGDNVQDVPGVVIRGTVQNPAIGTLSQLDNVTGWNSSYPGTADYVFSARKAGRTRVNFEGQINQIWSLSKYFRRNPIVNRRDFVSDSLSVTVADCRFKVSAVSQWKIKGPAKIRLRAVIDEAPLIGDPQGHYTGSASVKWSAGISAVGDCSGALTVDDRTAMMSGDMDNASGLLKVTITYLPTTAALDSNCKGANASWTISVAPDPVSFVTTADGGVSTQAHMLRGPENMPGRVQIDVTAQE
jgi:hypothetical protein